MVGWIEVDEAALEEARAVNAFVEEMIAAAPSIDTVEPEETRRARLAGESWMGPVVTLDRAEDRRIETERGPLTLRAVLPEHLDAVYLHIHGGGWALGGADQQDVLLAGIADEAGVGVLSVEYRLAPEHPYPAALEDCEAAALWLIENARAELGVERLIIGGESAGAHLAVLTLLRMRERLGTVAPFAAANLVFGAYDLAQTPSCRRWGERNLILSGPIMRWFAELFTPQMSDEERRDPAVSPLYADLSDLVPALFLVGALDPLLDDSLFMGLRWRAAGNPSEVAVYPEVPHGFVAFPTRIAAMALQHQVGFISRHARGAREP